MTATDLAADRLESIRARAVQGYAPTMRDTLNLVAEVERLRADTVPRSALVAALAELDAEHRPESYDYGGQQGCRICWPKDGSWPCVTRLVADELRALVEGATDA